MITHEECKYAVIGAVVSVATSFTGIGPVIGGAAASYLHGRDGPRVGALSGAISMIPFVLLAIPLVIFLGLFLGIGADLFAIGLFGALLLALGFTFALAISVVLGALGGWIGIVVLEETEFGRHPKQGEETGER